MSTRRAFLASAASAATVGSITAAAKEAVIHQPLLPPDAELIAVCAEFDRMERAYIATGGDHAAGSPEQAAADAEQARIAEAQEPLAIRMVELRAVTREGMAARARSLALWNAELLKDEPGDTGECLTYAIVRDLIAMIEEVRA